MYCLYTQKNILMTVTNHADPVEYRVYQRFLPIFFNLHFRGVISVVFKCHFTSPML